MTISDAHMTDRSEEAKRALLRAAADCFMARGYRATSIDDVARRLGATKGCVYHHFASKADLFFAVYRHGMALNHAAIAPALALSGSAAARLAAMARAHTLSMIETQPFQRVVWEGVEMHLTGATTPEQRVTLGELQRLRDDYEALFRAEMRAGMLEGDFVIPNLSIAVQAFFHTLNSVVFWYRPRHGETPEARQQLVAALVQFALRGLGLKGA